MTNHEIEKRLSELSEEVGELTKNMEVVMQALSMLIFAGKLHIDAKNKAEAKQDTSKSVN